MGCCYEFTSSYRVIGALLVAHLVKDLPANVGDLREVGSIPGSGRSPREGNVNVLQYSCLKNSMDRGTWWATVRKVAKSQTQLSMHTQAYTQPNTGCNYLTFMTKDNINELSIFF